MLRKPLRPNAKRKTVSRELPVPFPVGGWNSKAPLAGMDPQFAVQLLNWFPQPAWGEVRRGYTSHTTNVVSSSTSVETLMAWRGTSDAILFAAGGGSIYDVTDAGAGTVSASGLANDRWQHVNFTTPAGHFLFCVNGVDDPRHFNGTTWVNPAITGMTVASAIGVNSHKKRLWLIPKQSTTAYYLATDSVAGAATSFALGSLFTRGGTLQAMGTWSRDGGSGPDDYAVFISSEGQVALYQGTNPASPTTWSLVGTYDVPPPIGRRCFIKYGADLALLTMQGVFPLSQLLSVDESQAQKVALSDNITPDFSTAARSYKSVFGWEAVVYPRGTRLIVNIPTVENSTAKQYVMNTLTGAWCEFNAHNANCWIVFDDLLYFGANDGVVYRADIGSVDDTAEIVAVGQTAYGALGSAAVKTFKLCRPLVTTSGAGRPEVGVSTDFQETDLLSSGASISSSQAVFDTAEFDSAVFASDTNNVSDWLGLSGIGTFGSIKFRGRLGVGADVTGGVWGDSEVAPDADVLLEDGSSGILLEDGTSRLLLQESGASVAPVGTDENSWDAATWGGIISEDQTLRINGFMVTAEFGGVL